MFSHKFWEVIPKGHFVVKTTNTHYKEFSRNMWKDKEDQQPLVQIQKNFLVLVCFPRPGSYVCLFEHLPVCGDVLFDTVRILNTVHSWCQGISKQLVRDASRIDTASRNLLSVRNIFKVKRNQFSFVSLFWKIIASTTSAETDHFRSRECPCSSYCSKRSEIMPSLVVLKYDEKPGSPLLLSLQRCLHRRKILTQARLSSLYQSLDMLLRTRYSQASTCLTFHLQLQRIAKKEQATTEKKLHGCHHC